MLKRRTAHALRLMPSFDMTGPDERHSPLTDAAVVPHRRAAAGARIICFVPSITELVCDLGARRNECVAALSDRRD